MKFYEFEMANFGFLSLQSLTLYCLLILVKFLIFHSNITNYFTINFQIISIKLSLQYLQQTVNEMSDMVN